MRCCSQSLEVILTLDRLDAETRASLAALERSRIVPNRIGTLLVAQWEHLKTRQDWTGKMNSTFRIVRQPPLGPTVKQPSVR